jgi:hypothetical protein
MTMIRIIAIVGGGLALAACSSNSEWLNLDALKPKPTMETIRFESEPPGAEAKISTGQTCRTPCALAVQQPGKESGAMNVTFTLNGYEPASEDIQLVSQGDGTSQFRPNPVTAQLTAAPPPKKKTVRKKKKALSKPSAKPKAAPKAAAKPAAKPAAAAPAAPAQAPSPWPPMQTPPKQ